MKFSPSVIINIPSQISDDDFKFLVNANWPSHPQFDGTVESLQSIKNQIVDTGCGLVLVGDLENQINNGVAKFFISFYRRDIKPIG